MLKNIFHEAETCLKITEPKAKIAYGLEVVNAWKNKQLDWQCAHVATQLNEPGRLSHPELVATNKVSKRGFGSDKQIAAFLHSLAHIEITAVNLSWDSICRYPNMPQAYYDDWVNTAADEGRHFLALAQQMQRLGYAYGDFVAHNELWGMAIVTADDLMSRMGIVHRVLEARALDVIPFAISKFEAIGDNDSAKVLQMIANDEISHVAAGTRWYRYCCLQQNLDADTTFFQLIAKYLSNYPRGPFNEAARIAAGFSENELELLKHYDAQYKKTK